MTYEASSRTRPLPTDDDSAQPTWSRWSQAPAVVLDRGHLARTIGVALVVGSILFVINQLDTVMSGEATSRTWVKAAITYVVPFCVANYGVLTATRRTPDA